MRKLNENQGKGTVFPSPTGMAPAISQGTAATDNLSAMMKNTVVVMNVRKVDALPGKSLNRGTSDVRQDS